MWNDFISYIGDATVLVAIGTAVGWNFPQPPWAVWTQAKLVEGYQWAKAKLSD